MQYITTFRSNRSMMFFEIGVLKNFAMFTGDRCLLLYIIFIRNLMKYKHRKIGYIYFQYKVLRLYHVSISPFTFSQSLFLKLFKHVKLIIVFENIMNVKQNIRF